MPLMLIRSRRHVEPDGPEAPSFLENSVLAAAVDAQTALGDAGPSTSWSDRKRPHLG